MNEQIVPNKEMGRTVIKRFPTHLKNRRNFARLAPAKEVWILKAGQLYWNGGGCTEPAQS